MKIYCYKHLSGRIGRGNANQGVTRLLHAELAIIKIVIKLLPHEADGRFLYFLLSCQIPFLLKEQIDNDGLEKSNNTFLFF